MRWPQDGGPRRRSQAGGQPPGVADAAGQPAVPAQPLGALPFLSVLAGGPGSAPPALVFFVASIRAAGQCFCGRAVVFHFWRLRLLHESLLSGRSFLTPCTQKLATTLCPSSLSPAVCQFVLVAARRFLQSVTYFVGRSARVPRRFAFAAFDLLICGGVEAGPW